MQRPKKVPRMNYQCYQRLSLSSEAKKCNKEVTRPQTIPFSQQAKHQPLDTKSPSHCHTTYGFSSLYV
uniref:Putative valacyclovir hydrolase n=1 Tax=Ixodes ricinus TaxID=34613 RepID=A0A0K8R976_IXORI